MGSVIRFGTDGWRAIMNDEFILKNVKLVAGSIGIYIKENNDGKNGVFVGYDNRFFSEKFAEEVAKTLSSFGLKVLLSPKPLPTPTCAFAVINQKLSGGVMITASHNPPYYNGIKFIPDYGGPAFPEITKSIENNIKRIQKGKPKGEQPDETRISTYDPTGDYIEHLKKIIDFDLISSSNMKIALDPMYGSGVDVVKELFGNIKCETETLHDFRDPYFGGRLPDPSETNLGELKDKVLNEGFDIGLALDGDADRFGIIDSKGNFLKPNQVLPLIAFYMIKEKKESGILVRSIATTHLIDAIGKKWGIDTIETPVGFKFIAREMIGGKVILGGEESGGFSLSRHIPEKDGILANLILLEMTAFYKMPLSSVLEQIYDEFGEVNTKRIDVECDDEKKSMVIEKIKGYESKKVGNFEIKSKYYSDGVKILFKDNSWILLRPSGTESLIRVYLEAFSKESLEELEEFALSFFK